MDWHYFEPCIEKGILGRLVKSRTKQSGHMEGIDEDRQQRRNASEGEETGFLFKLKIGSRQEGLPPAYHYDLESRT